MWAARIKPDYRMPGFKYKRQPGQLSGKLYTAFPMRFVIAVKNAIVTSILAFIVLWTLLSLGDDPDSFIDALLLAITILIFGYPFFVIYDPGKRIKITSKELVVGFLSYDLAHVSAFYQIPYYNQKNRLIGYCIGFRNGEQEEEIFVLNNAEASQSIIPFLNRAREAIQSEQTPIIETEKVEAGKIRSAEF